MLACALVAEPATEQTTTKPIATSASQRAARSVLIVEDDSLLRQSLAAALSSDFRVRTAAGGTEALDILHEWEPDAILLDMVLADGDGFSVLAAVAGLTRRPRVVVLSALDQATKAVKAMRLGASDYLVKPCGLATVRRVLNDALSSESRLGGRRTAGWRDAS